MTAVFKNAVTGGSGAQGLESPLFTEDEEDLLVEVTALWVTGLQI